MKRIFFALAAIFLGSAPAQAEWRRADSPNFIVYSEGSPEQLEEFTRTLEKFDSLLRLLAPVRPQATPVRLTVVLLGSQRSVASLAGSSFVAGFYHATVENGPFAVVPRSGGASIDDLSPEVVLFHEYAHHFMLQNYSTIYPEWFVEGYAELLSTTNFRPDGSIRFGEPPAHRRYELWQRWTIPLRVLLFGGEEERRHYDETAFYAQSWFLTHFLTFDKDRKGQLSRYITLIASGRPAEEAAQEAFGDIRSLERDFVRYRRARSLPYITLPQASLPEVPEVQISRLPAAEEALMFAKLRYFRGVGRDEVQEFASDVRERAASNDPAALQMLANGEYLAGNYEAATSAVDALLKLQPNAPRALMRKALIEMKQLEIAESSDADRWTQARRRIIEANRLTPDDPFILYHYYTSFRRQGMAAPADARLGLARAVQLLPQVSGLRMALARSLIDERRYDEAEPLLASIAYAPHQGGIKETALQLLETIAPLPDGAEMPSGTAEAPASDAVSEGDIS